MKTDYRLISFEVRQNNTFFETREIWTKIILLLLPLVLAITVKTDLAFADKALWSQNIQVKTLKVKPETLELKATSVGRLYPNREVKILAEISGMITEFYLDTGDEVKKGQVLVRIDPTDYQLALDRARAELKSVKIQYNGSLKQIERSKELARKKIISQEAFDNLETELKTNQAELNRAQIMVQSAEHQLNKTIIRAPFDGMIEERVIEVGQLVEFGNALFSLIDLSVIRAKINILEEEYVHLDKRDPVKIDIDVYPEKSFKGTIDKIGISADQKNAFPIEVVIQNHNLLLKAGFSARVSIILKKLKNVYFVPADALIYDRKGPGVLIVNKNNEVVWRSVRTGKMTQDRIPVLSGLNTNDRVIIRGQNDVKVNSKITVSN